MTEHPTGPDDVDPDGDPEMLTARDTRGQTEDDPDADPDADPENLNPRGA